VRTSALGLAAALLWVAACGGGEGEAGADADATGGGNASVSAEPARAERASAEREAPRRQERPLPAFSGFTLEGEKLEISSLLGRRLLVLFFNPEVPQSETLVRAVRGIEGLRGDHNFQIVGVATGSETTTAEAFARDEGLDFPVIDDSRGAITRRLGLRSPVAVLGVDGDGYIVFGFTQVPSGGEEAARAVEGQIRSALRLPERDAPAQPVLGARPEAPHFTAEGLDREEPFDLADHEGRPVALMFFLHTCPHCHHALEAAKASLAELPEDSRVLFVGVEVSGRTAAVRQELARQDLDFFPVLWDRDGSLREAYGVFAGVPDIVLIDAQGRIAARMRGWNDATDGPLLRMRLAKLAGGPVPMLLRTRGYSGNEVCGVCHQAEHETWLLTTHAHAYDTLVKHGADQDPECVSCHVVGFGEPGGFESPVKTPALEDVGCESCHGRGGPHLSPDFVAGGDYEARCVECHDAKHSLGFEYATFLPRVSHAANRHLLDLPVAEKRRLLAERGALKKELLPERADYVGSEACRDCHAAEYATWSESGHARAGDTLVEADAAGNADCLRCHTTAFGKPTGFPTGGKLSQHPDLGRVGCESCHGPGGDHVPESAPKTGTIVSLGDKCDSCAILQVCGGCHDDANDPGFEFEVLEKIEAQEHGTIEPSVERSAHAAPEGAGTPEEAVARAFRALDGRG